MHYSNRLLLLESFVALVTILQTIFANDSVANSCPATDEECRRPDSSHLIDLSNFSYLVLDPICGKVNKDSIIAVFIIASKTDNFEQRTAQRDTWAQSRYARDLRYRVAFLLGRGEDAAVQEKILAESAAHGDLVQGNFEDTYANLTYKHVMGLKWAAAHCAEAAYTIKVDDDVYVDVFWVMRDIRERFGVDPPGKNLIVCGWLFSTNKPYRDSTNKYYVSYEEYPWDEPYPEFCSGAAILYSRDVAERIYDLAFSTRYFKLEDVYATSMIRRKIGVRPLEFDSLGLQWNPAGIQKYIKQADAKRYFRFGLTTETRELYLLWEKLKR